MAIYSTFFVCKADDLLSAFPSWKLPLPEPVKRDVVNPFTKETMTIETRCPEWPNEETVEESERQYVVISGQGRYEDYLEGRLPRCVRERPHACWKNLTQVELDPLGEAAGFAFAVDDALFCPPHRGDILLQFRHDLIAKLLTLSEDELLRVAERWAVIMSGPEHTHSVTGVRIHDDWEPSDAMKILQSVVRLACQVNDDRGIYVLIEC